MVAAFAAHALGTEGRDAVPFTAPAVVAAAIAVAARDLDRQREGALSGGLRDATAARVATLAAAILALLLVHDLASEPARALASIVPVRPGSAAGVDAAPVRVAGLLFATALAVTAYDAPPKTEPLVDRYLAWPRALARTWHGNLGTALMATEAALMSLALVTFVRPERAAPFGEILRATVRHAWWAVPVLVLAVAWVPMAARDAAHAARRCARLPRGASLIVAGTLTGAVLAWGYYPALLGQASAREALAAYRALHAPGEQLGALGVDARAASLEVGENVHRIADAPAAAAFLASSSSAARSWLVLRRDDLPALNAIVRARDGRNVALVAGASGSLLATSARRTEEPRAEASLDDLVLREPPPIAHPVEAAVGDAILALGWDLTSASGEVVDALVPLATRRLRLYYRVVGKVDDGLCTFVHIDGQGRRHNAEHREFPRYPLRYWRPGDVLVDEFEIALGGNFTPGAYALRYGFDRLPCDGRARLAVTRGPHDGDNRVLGGTVHVR
jgi:hypothetical protein